MTDLARGARTRRGGRRPGWLLLTALLVLAIIASSTLVFTNRVELLRLAVILSLWAAVLAAFVSVIYRRQSQADEARAREMKYVYDLQLDREISARREYELSVESHLRRQLLSEMRAQAADDMAALRTELVSLRANLEMLLGTDLGERPALESDREPVAEPLTMTMPPPPGRVESSRVTATVVTEDRTSRRVFTEEITAEVAEEIAEEVPQEVVEESLRQAERAAAERVAAERLAAQRAEAERAAAERAAAERVAAERLAAQRAEAERLAAQRAEAERLAAQRAEAERVAAERAAAERAAAADRAAAAERLRSAPEPNYQGSHRRTEAPAAPWRPPETAARRGRHWNADGTVVPPTSPPARGRHWVEPTADQAPSPSVPETGGGRRRAPEPPEEAVAEAGQHADGASVADLMARLQAGDRGWSPGGQGGGGRRRREE